MPEKENRPAGPRKIKLYERKYVFEVLNESELLVYMALLGKDSVDAQRRLCPCSNGRKGTLTPVRKSYGDLCPATKLPKRTVQRAIARLLAKQFMQLASKAGHSKRTCAIYEVYDEIAISTSVFASGRTHWYRAGRGCVCVNEHGVDWTRWPIRR